MLHGAAWVVIKFVQHVQEAVCSVAAAAAFTAADPGGAAAADQVRVVETAPFFRSAVGREMPWGLAKPESLPALLVLLVLSLLSALAVSMLTLLSALSAPSLAP